jgi:catechol 2,3-dioxygenase-like lactoylglutathione lyase family enzyme
MKQVATYLNFDGNCRKAMQFYQKCLDTDIDHIDLRVPRLAEVVAFYEALLPALGFSRRMAIEGWSQFQAAGNMATEFFGITESPSPVPTENSIAFRAESPADVDGVARDIEGPMDYAPGYYPVFLRTRLAIALKCVTACARK